MELRRLSICLAFLLVAVISQCSEAVPPAVVKSEIDDEDGESANLLEARHSLSRRDTNDYFQGDEGTDTEQNDADIGDEEADEPERTATILSQPENYNVEEGKTVRLDCRIDVADSIVDWKKDGLGVIVNGFVMSDRKKYEKDGTNLIVKNLTAADAGVYECKVQQTDPVTIEHHLSVIEKPKVNSITATDDGHPQQGSDLTLTCEVSGNPAPTIVWSKVVDNNNTRLAEGRSYTIKNVNAEHSGRYLCYALTNKSSDTKEINIVVRGKPRMHVARTVINSAIGVEAVLQCSVHEEEPVTITWYKGRQQIDASRYSTRGTHSNLTVTPQSDDDFGAYTCKAECAVGTHHRTIELVQRPVVEELESEGNKLSWRVHSHQPLRNIQIQLINEDSSPFPIEVPVPETRTHEYDMSYVVDSPLKPGNYGVVIKVENSKGMSESNEQIVFQQVNSEPIRTASVSFLPGAATISRPTTALLSTVLMYLLVRMI